MESGEQTQHQQEYFTHCAERYDKTLPEQFIYTPTKQDLLDGLRQKGLLKEETRLVDVACGTGKLLELTGLNSSQLAGIDLTPAMIDVAKTKPGLAGASLVVGNANKLPWGDNAFDIVTTTFSFHHFASTESLAEARRVLTPGGILAIADLCPPPWMSAKRFDAVLTFLSRCGVGDYRNPAETEKFLKENGFDVFSQRRVKGLVLLTMARKTGQSNCK